MLRTAGLLVSLFVFAFLAAPASASHFRSGNLSWQKSSSVANGVAFQNTQAWRRDSFSDGSGSDGFPVTGDVIDNSEGCIVPDNGGSICPQYLVTFTNLAENYIVTRAIQGTNASDFNVIYENTSGSAFTAMTSSCCTISELLNSPDASWQVDALFDPADNESPRSSVPPIVNLPSGGVQNFTVPASDPGGQTLRFRLAGAACTNPSDPSSCAEPPDLTINESTGMVTWDTTGRDGLWWTGVKIEGLSAGNVISSTHIQYIIRVGGTGGGGAPVWSAPTPDDGTTFTVSPGQTLSLNLLATDPDSSDVVQILQNSGPGSTSSSDGNPASATFSYTPSASDLGKEEIVQFLAQDRSLNGPPFRSFKVRVVEQIPQPQQPQQPQEPQQPEQPGPTPTLALAGDASDLVGDTHEIEATALLGATPLASRAVRFAITGANATSGAATTNAAGKAKISWKGSKAGNDTVTAYVDLNGNSAADLNEPRATALVEWLSPPEPRKTANVEPVSGTVLIKLPRGASPAKWKLGPAQANGFIPLSEAKTIPLKSVVDATKGRIEVNTASTNRVGRIQSAQFYSGQFMMTQIGSRTRPITQMTMNAALDCSTKRKDDVTSAQRKKRRSRGLWGNGRGRFRTRGRHSSATVRGTVWYSKDTCTTTTTRVRSGTVIVRDFTRKKNVTVKKGKSYTARAKKPKKRKK